MKNSDSKVLVVCGGGGEPFFPVDATASAYTFVPAAADVPVPEQVRSVGADVVLLCPSESGEIDPGATVSVGSVPVIAVTIRADDALEERLLAAGVSDILRLPASSALVDARIRTQVRGHAPELERCGRLRDGSEVLNDLMRASLGTPTGLQEQLAATFDHLERLPWFRVVRRGTIMLRNSRDQLVQVAQIGFSPERATHCERVDLDRCGCGAVACEGGVSFRLCEGDRDLKEADVSQDWSHFILPLVDDQWTFGVATLFVEPGHRPTEAEMELAQDLAHLLSGIVSRCVMEEMVQVKEMELEEKQAEVILKLGAASEYRDTETGMHVMRMSHYAGAIAREMGMPTEERERLVMAAPMHDVGKIGIPDAILLKPDKLSSEEFESMKEHTRIGETLLKGDDKLMRTAQEIASSHHEKWDGTGYPAGMAGEGIPLSGRICAVADVFDALTSRRPYKEPWSIAKAQAFVHEQTGKAFDPAVVAAFTQAMPEILRIRELYRDEIIDPHDKLLLPELKREGEPWIVWDDSISVGIDIIDEHHRYLFDLTNDLYTAVKERRGVREVGQVLRALERYTHVHFREEERMMRHHGYSDLERHMRLHAGFCSKLREFWWEFKANPLTMGFEMIYFLRDWLVVHIQKEDSKLDELMAEKG